MVKLYKLIFIKYTTKKYFSQLICEFPQKLWFVLYCAIRIFTKRFKTFKRFTEKGATVNMQAVLTIAFLFNCLSNTKTESYHTLFSGESGNYDNIHNPNSCASRTYDYIVVGSGAAGSVVAHRLSTNRNISVLLLEAGGLPTFISEIPFFFPIQMLAESNWKYHSVKQNNFGLGFVNQTVRWDRGKALGGSSVINYMVYSRGNPSDYEKWAAAGNSGWSYKDVLPYFMKSENSLIKKKDFGYHGSNGLLTVEDILFRTKLSDVFLEACKQTGYPYVDYNGKNQLGVSHLQQTTRNHRRCSAEKAFIRPASFRPNLHICIYSRVSKVLINERKIAYGVEFINGNKKFVAYAKREVVLSAGPFHSPQVLMLSGIGPKNHLERFNIPVVHDLPVGEKLYDHPMFIGLVFTVNQSIGVDTSHLFSLNHIYDLILHNTGLLTWPGIDLLAFYKSDVANYSESYPDIELLFASSGIQIDLGLFFKNMFGILPKIYNAIWKNLEFKQTWTVFVTLLHPKSYGKMKLRSSNPLDDPLLFGNYLSDSDNYDLKALISGIRLVQRLANTPAFLKYGSQQVTTPVPGCNEIPYDTDQYWECAIRHLTTTIWHQTTTCKMGPTNDPEAVVDHKLRVYGIKNLRVIDTSILPVTISGHTNAPAYMIGEKGADMLLEDYNRRV